MRIDKIFEKYIEKYNSIDNKTYIKKQAGIEYTYSFDWDYYSKNIEELKLLNDNLYIFGPPGTGKTFFAKNLARYKQSTKLFKWYDIIEKRLNGDSNNNKSVYEFISPKCLIIDDFLSRKATEFNINLFFEIIDTRFDLNKKTIITTNYKPEEFKRILFSQNWIEKHLLNRINSRMKNFRFINFDGNDMRGIKNDKN